MGALNLFSKNSQSNFCDKCSDIATQIFQHYSSRGTVANHMSQFRRQTLLN